MNPEAQEVLNKILAKDLHELTEDDKAFMRARSAYIGRRSQEKFASVFGRQEKKEPEVDKDVHLNLDQPTNGQVEEVAQAASNPFEQNDGDDEA